MRVWDRDYVRVVRTNCIPEHGQGRNVYVEKAVLFGAQFLEAPQAEFGESLGRCSR